MKPDVIEWAKQNNCDKLMYDGEASSDVRLISF